MNHGCMYFDPGCPTNVCYACEHEKRARMVAQKNATAYQLSLADGNPQRAFTNAQIHNTSGVHADSNGFNRVLLASMRQSLGVAKPQEFIVKTKKSVSFYEPM